MLNIVYLVSFQAREEDKCQIEELMEKVSNLQLEKNQSLDESGNLAFQLERMNKENKGTFKYYKNEKLVIDCKKSI